MEKPNETYYINADMVGGTADDAQYAVEWLRKHGYNVEYRENIPSWQTDDDCPCYSVKWEQMLSECFWSRE